MGEVYLAHHASLRRPCAVKILKQELCTPDAVARFEREAEAASRLRHPNTIAVFDFGRTDEGQPYYVMEYLDGCDLRQLVQRDGPLSPDRAEYLLHQAAASLAEAHLLSMVHRDVQPGNLFVTANAGHGDFVKVLDFGLVKGIDLGPEITQGETFMGTPRYMAPEALTGKPVDCRADVYSLAAVGYYLLCGEAPFASGDSHADMYRQVHEAPPGIAKRRPANLPVPSLELQHVIEACLSKAPADRLASAGELREALEKVPEHGRWHPARAQSTPPSERPLVEEHHNVDGHTTPARAMK
jgi:eukaryotic-like serine/threonine-protein kinase